jgi:Holliday junction resolvase RusA-like endonuclease
MTIEFFASGEPKGQPRPRAFAFNGKARIYDCGSAEGWKSQIAEAVRPHLPPTPLTSPLQMNIRFFFPRPKSHYRTGKNAGILKDTAPIAFTSKPDIDNLQKAVMDALMIVGLIKDDSQVVEIAAGKSYAEKPGAKVEIRTRL